MNSPSPVKAVSIGSPRAFQFQALDCQCSIKFYARNDRDANAFINESVTWLRAFELRSSRFSPDSVISRINAAAGLNWVPVDAEMERLLDIAGEFHQRTLGLLDPTLLPLLRIWDWRSIHLKLPDPSKVKAALALTGWHLVERRPGAVRLPKPGMGLDFGYFTKEFAVDQLTRIAIQHEISNAMIELGRDFFALGGEPAEESWNVEIENGEKPGQSWGELSISDKAVSTSGDFARYFVHDGERYGHLIDPRTGWPVVNGMRAVTVVAPSCLMAGMYASAIFITGRQEGLHFASLGKNVEACIQSVDGIEGSRNFDHYFVRVVT